jgi:hypothetical protein
MGISMVFHCHINETGRKSVLPEFSKKGYGKASALKKGSLRFMGV